jgi:hypothetical protein
MNAIVSFQLVGTAEAARIVGVSPARIRQFVMTGELEPALKVPGANLFDRAVIEQLARQRANRRRVLVT